jgi:uncharacterized membrane protein
MATLNRIPSIDILRGLVMIIMALDHTRDYFHITSMTADPLDPSTTTTGLFFTRWITHFCAPIFVFLSGLSAYLSAQNKTPVQASSFLAKRGLWLVIAEVTIVSFGLTFNPFFNFVILQVIWAIGWSMILLGFVSRLSYRLVFILGIILVVGHDLINYLPVPQSNGPALTLKVLFTASGTVVPLSSSHLIGVFYAILPWTGILFLGYAAGVWYQKDFSVITRKQYLLLSGIGLTLLFIILRINNGYGDPSLRKDYPTLLQNILSFLNASKYPPSLLYSCMTIGPALILLSILENCENRLSRLISNYGSVPFFYYIIHFYLLHLLLVLAFFLTGHSTNEIVQVPFLFRPVAFGFSLPIVYLIWIIVVLALYQPCVWFKRYKTNHNQWWLKYI